MAITTNAISITIGGYTFCQSPTGIDFSGCLCGESFCDARAFQGKVAGYLTGSQLGPTADVIQKFPFTSDTPSTDVGELSQARRVAAGQSSVTSGYTSGGNNPGICAQLDTIDKFPFSTDSPALDVGELTQIRQLVTGQSSKLQGFGYTSGGYNSFCSPLTNTRLNTVDKFPFAADASATDVGDLSQARHSSSGQSSLIAGYTSGGNNGSFLNTIDRFPFASGGNSIDTTDLAGIHAQGAGQSSATDGYVTGGFRNPPPLLLNWIQKFPFANDSTASIIGALTNSQNYSSGQSSTTSGYNSGGRVSPPFFDTIEKFPFASDTNSTDIGELLSDTGCVTGQQV